MAMQRKLMKLLGIIIQRKMFLFLIFLKLNDDSKLA
jgi:hypothetical protein